MSQAINQSISAATAVPPIVDVGAKLSDQSDIVLAALQELREEQAVYGRGDDIVQARFDPNSKQIALRSLDERTLPGVADRAVEFVRYDKNGNSKPAMPPVPVIRDIVYRRSWELPRLRQLLRVPAVLPDGRLLSTEGYDPDSGLYLSLPGGFRLPPIPDEPTQADARAALEELWDFYQDFPFATDADRANALSEPIAIATRAMRPLVGPGSATPMYAHDGTMAGSGKGRLANLGAIIASGQPAALQPAEGGDAAEWRKRITSHIQEAAPVVLFDNATTPLRDPSLCAALTSESYWSDRPLGYTRTTHLPIVTLFIVTGNQLRLVGDIQRRVIPVRLVPKTERPDLRPSSDFAHPDLLTDAQRDYARLYASVLTMIRAWVVAGRPSHGVPLLGSFEAFCKQVGGIMHYAGADAWLGNQQGYRDEQDEDSTAWRTFLREWHQLLGERRLTVAQLVPLLRGEGTGAEVRASDKLRAALPPELVSYSDDERARFPARLGVALHNHKERPHGEYRLRRAEGFAHASGRVWYVVPLAARTATDTEPTESVSVVSNASGASPDMRQRVAAYIGNDRNGTAGAETLAETLGGTGDGNVSEQAELATSADAGGLTRERAETRETFSGGSGHNQHTHVERDPSDTRRRSLAQIAPGAAGDVSSTSVLSNISTSGPPGVCAVCRRPSPGADLCAECEQLVGEDASVGK